jgi:ABC-type lipoprotein release transport system permease subunit
MEALRDALVFAGRTVAALAGDRFLWRLAWRNVWRNGRRAMIVLVAVAVGISGTVLSMAINFGMVVQMVQTAISTELGHLEVHAPGFADDPGLGRRLPDDGQATEAVLRGLPEVAAWAPRIRSQGLLSSPRASAGVRVMAIDPGREARITTVAHSVTEGAYLGAAPRRVLLGEALARRLGVGVGAKVVLSATDVRGDLTGEAFRVAGLFRTPSAELDRSTIYVRLDEAQRLFALGDSISEVVVRARDRAAIPAIRTALRRSLGGRVEVETWEQLAPFLVYLVDAFEEMAWITYAAVFVAMAFGIANVLLMSVFERTREFGVVRAMGMSGPRVVALVVLESLFLTFVGLLAGFAVTGLALYALRGGIDLSRFAQGLGAMGIGTTLVPVARLSDFSTPSVVALVTAVAAGLWPAVRAARAQPADALRGV